MEKMKKLALITILIASILLIGVSGCVQQNVYPNYNESETSNNNEGNTENTITISGFTFSPSEITINKGDSVTWTNNDPNAHTIVSDSGNELNSGTISHGQSYSHTFNSTGTFSYHCSIHASMKGSVIVK